MEQPLQQHTLRTKEEYRALLGGIDLHGRVVVEIGVGTGALTELLIERAPERIIGYEIDPALCQLSLPLLELHCKDFRAADLSATDDRYCLIANPPYDLLDDVLPLVVGPSRIFEDVILMVPERALASFVGFEVAFALDPEAFDPPTKPGRHLVIRRGFLQRP